MITTSRLNPLFPVQLIADGRNHFYKLGDDEVMKPGVTTVLKVLDKPALIPWAVKACSDNIQSELLRYPDTLLSKQQIIKICEDGKQIYKKKAADAADIGSRVHRAVNSLIEQGEWVSEPDIVAGVQGFIDWKASHSLTIELGDTKIGSKLFGYGGSLDMVAFDKDEAIIFDFKTTKKRKDRDHGIYDEYAYQLAAYAQAFQETYGIKVKEVVALWLNKEKPEFKAVKIANISVCLEGFLAALKIYQVQKLEKFNDGII